MKIYDGEQYRNLTPKEYFRLMGFADEDVELLEENGISKTQLYKMAGNSIPIKMLEHLFRSLIAYTTNECSEVIFHRKKQKDNRHPSRRNHQRTA